MWCRKKLIFIGPGESAPEPRNTAPCLSVGGVVNPTFTLKSQRGR